MSEYPQPGATAIFDESEMAFEQTISPELYSRTYKSFMAEAAIELSTRFAVPGGGSKFDCSAIDCADYISKLVSYFETKVAECCEGYSDARWLWYLRRIPTEIFGGRVSTTMPYDLALADISTGLYGTGVDNLSKVGTQWTYPVAGAVSNRIIRLCCAVRALSQMHVNSRYVGKGSAFRFSHGDPIPKPNPEKELESAVRLYDERGSRRETPFARSGTSLSSEGEAVTPLRGFFAIHRIERTWLKAPKFVLGTSEEFQVFANFGPSWVSLDTLKALIADPRLSYLNWVDDLTVALFEILCATPMAVANTNYRYAMMLQRGYYIVEEEQLNDIIGMAPASFFDAIQEVVPELKLIRSAAELISALESANGTLWPVKCGPIIRRSGKNLWVDLYSATARLESALEFPRVDGEAANVRSAHFENAVQAIIDGSPWKPSPEIGALRGRTLRLLETALTDIDAIACRGDVLILVSCKSVVYSASYDTGDFKIVRNIASVVEKAVKDWESTCEKLRTNKRGDNYDFSAYKEILGVVCTPYVVYVPNGAATSEVRPGLLAAVSSDELSKWLRD